MAEYEGILSRLEEGPAYVLDLMIAQALVPDIVVLRRNNDDNGNEPHTYRSFTADIGDALWLVECKLPGWTWNVGGCPTDFLTDKDKPFGCELMGPVSWEVIDHEVGYPEPVYDTASGQASTPAIAILTALFRALQAKEGKDG